MSGRARSMSCTFVIFESTEAQFCPVRMGHRAGSIETAMHQRMASSIQRDQLQTTMAISGGAIFPLFYYDRRWRAG